MNKFKEELIHDVIKQIVDDIEHSYYEGIEALLNHIDVYKLIAFLPEEKREKWRGDDL
jgi:hypothetical protein